MRTLNKSGAILIYQRFALVAAALRQTCADFPTLDTPVIKKMLAAMGFLAIAWFVFRIGYSFAAWMSGQRRLSCPNNNYFIGFTKREARAPLRVWAASVGRMARGRAIPLSQDCVAVPIAAV